MTQQRSIFCLLVLAGLLGIPGTATAQNTFSVVVDGQTRIDSPTPVSMEGGDATVGGSVRADSPLKAEAHAYVAGTNVLTSDFREFGGQALTHHEDVVISGPGLTAPINLRLPVHANFSQSFKLLTDGSIDSDSSVTQSMFVSAMLVAPGLGLSLGQIEINVNRSTGLATVTPQTQFGSVVEFHATPRATSGPPIEGT